MFLGQLCFSLCVFPSDHSPCKFPMSSILVDCMKLNVIKIKSFYLCSTIVIMNIFGFKSTILFSELLKKSLILFAFLLFLMPFIGLEIMHFIYIHLAVIFQVLTALLLEKSEVSIYLHPGKMRLWMSYMYVKYVLYIYIILIGNKDSHNTGWLQTHSLYSPR